MRYTIFAAGIVLATLLSSASAMAQTYYNDDNKGWNRGHTQVTTVTAATSMCFKAYGDKQGAYTGPQLHGKSDAATHGWQNYWGPCANAGPPAEGKKTAAKH